MRWNSRKLRLLVPMLIILIAISAYPEDVEIGNQVGQRAPDFDLPLLNGNGEEINLYEQIEKHDVILLYFFFAAT